MRVLNFLRNATLFLVSLPANVFALILALPQWARGSFRFKVESGCLWLHCPTMGPGGRTLGPNIIQIWNVDELRFLKHHELVHSEQAQAASLLGAATSIVIWAEGRPWWGVLMPVTFAWLASAGAAYATAWLRREPTYEGAHIEEAAYAEHHHAGQNQSLRFPDAFAEDVAKIYGTPAGGDKAGGESP